MLQSVHTAADHPHAKPAEHAPERVAKHRSNMAQTSTSVQAIGAALISTTSQISTPASARGRAQTSVCSAHCCSGSGIMSKMLILATASSSLTVEGRVDFLSKAERQCHAYAACTPMNHAHGHLPSIHMLQPIFFNTLLVTCCSCTSLINRSASILAGCHTPTHTVHVLLIGCIASGAKESAVQLALHVHAPWMPLLGLLRWQV